jgi:3-dehydroquinate synthase
VPSSAVITYAGGVLGWPGATLVALTGLTLGSVLGFALARWLGPPFLKRFSDQSTDSRFGRWIQDHGVTALILTRALPILAEACVLILGSKRMPWRQFLPPVLVCNALMALAYSVCGAIFSGGHGFLIAIIASGALPLAVALLARRRLSTRTPGLRGIDPPGLID